MKKEIDAQPQAAGKPPEINISRATDNTLRMRLSGNWRIDKAVPTIEGLEKQLKSEPRAQKITFDTSKIAGWDSSLLTFLIDITQLCTRAKISIDSAGLPDGVPQLLTIAAAVPEKKDTGRGAARESFLTRVGENATVFFQSAADMLGFIGDAFVTFIKMFGGKTRFRGYDLVLLIRQCGADALPIVTLISLLVGLILAFVGAIQLEMFGAQIYVANLVGIAMVRVLGAVMTGIIMAGRMGAAFAAQLGTMQVNEELDALEVLGISPMEFLVLPRMLALILMMPLLCLIEMEDVVVPTKDDKGKVKLHQAVNLTAAGAVGGGFWGMLIGMIFLNPLAGAAIGAGAGALSGKMRDLGISDDFMKELGETFQAGTSALFVLVRKATPDKILEELKGFKGKVLKTSLTRDKEEELREVLERS